MKLHQIKVTLTGVRPLLWRRLLLSSEITLGKLHEILQIALGWENSHMHQFVKDGSTYSDPHFELGDMVIDERKVAFGDVLAQPESRLLYEYDFGDDWKHELLCEDVLESDEKSPYVLCIDGARACPPEDCGGPEAYHELLRVLENPKHKDYEEMRDWVGATFNPDVFNAEDINRRLPKNKSRKK